MEKLGATSIFTVSGFDANNVGHPVVDAHFIVDMTCSPLINTP
ncbi:hypothetical protein C7420_106354 [Pantoea ananatis]|jgi:hypothetical protein|nr:hypothetical protein C7426_101395 [Pantoea ananatis]RAR69958.1 hypothetical protein C7420_106354 [Pantoea ananatis]REC92922.1 hypothetical protein C7423_101307 [Pantoea ananatis]